MLHMVARYVACWKLYVLCCVSGEDSFSVFSIYIFFRDVTDYWASCLPGWLADLLLSRLTAVADDWLTNCCRRHYCCCCIGFNGFGLAWLCVDCCWSSFTTTPVKDNVSADIHRRRDLPKKINWGKKWNVVLVDFFSVVLPPISFALPQCPTPPQSSY